MQKEVHYKFYCVIICRFSALLRIYIIHTMYNVHTLCNVSIYQVNYTYKYIIYASLFDNTKT